MMMWETYREIVEMIMPLVTLLSMIVIIWQARIIRQLQGPGRGVEYQKDGKTIKRVWIA